MAKSFLLGFLLFFYVTFDVKHPVFNRRARQRKISRSVSWFCIHLLSRRCSSVKDLLFFSSWFITLLREIFLLNLSSVSVSPCFYVCFAPKKRSKIYVFSIFLMPCLLSLSKYIGDFIAEWNSMNEWPERKKRNRGITDKSWFMNRLGKVIFTTLKIFDI